MCAGVCVYVCYANVIALRILVFVSALYDESELPTLLDTHCNLIIEGELRFFRGFADKAYALSPHIVSFYKRPMLTTVGKKRFNKIFTRWRTPCVEW
jgi:hypothetical protein